MRHLPPTLIALSALITLVACQPGDKTPETPDEPHNYEVAEVSATIEWAKNQPNGSWPLAEKDGVLYYPIPNGDYTGLRAVNADTGATVWEDTSRGGGDSLAVFFSNGKIGELSGAGLFLYEIDGTFDRMIEFSTPLRVFRGEPVVSGNTIFFGTREYGMCRFNIVTDPVFNGGKWVVTPEELYATPPDSDGDNDIRWQPPAIHDGVLYSGVYPVWAQPGTFFAIKLSTKALLWETIGDYLRAWSFWPLTYHNDTLIALDPYGFGILDPAAGEILVEHDVYYAGGMYSGGFIYNNRVYFTGGSTASNEDNPNNVKCIDLDTGEAVWMQSFPYSHGSNPVCHEGITYVFAQECLRLLDAETGQLLGVDDSIHGDAWQICNVLKYKDTAIVKHATALYSVKLDFRTDGKGNLWKAN